MTDNSDDFRGKNGHQGGQQERQRTQNPPLVPLAKLWKRTAKSGNEYFTGFLQDARVLVFENREHDPNDPRSHTHQLYVQTNDKRQG